MEEDNGIEKKSKFFITFIKELAGQERERNMSEQKGDIDIKEVWRMPTTWVMKMLYFTLLQITKDKRGNMQRSFEICGNYEAWSYGPVEVDAYRMLKDPFYEYSIYARWEEGEIYCKAEISSALVKLYRDSNFSKLIGCTDSLISLSHNLIIWQEAKRYSSSKMNLSKGNVEKEYNKFTTELSTNVNKYIF